MKSDYKEKLWIRVTFLLLNLIFIIYSIYAIDYLLFIVFAI